LTGNEVFISDQRVFVLKRKGDLWIEMLKQVQHDGIPDEEPRTWTRSVGTKNRSSRRTGSWFGTKDQGRLGLLGGRWTVDG